MTTFNRWCLVALGVVLVVGIPVAVRALPAGDSSISSTELLARVTAADDHPYSGYVETQGTLQLPVADRFTDIGALFGEDTRMRVWWRSSDDWRVDKLLTAGETDLVHDASGTTEYSYEDARATVSRDPDIRLPRTADLVPPVLGARLLRDVDASSVVRIPARRVAGVSAPGLRLAPASPQASVDHVDLWADPATGLPLRVEVYAHGATTAAFTTSFRDFSSGTPASDRTTFQATPGTDVRYDDVLDIADAANQYAPITPPDTVAGLPRATSSDGAEGAVGVYGTGVTQIITIPLRDREADPLREQLLQTPGVRAEGGGTVVSVGPLGVLLTGADGDGGWLVAGTVTEKALLQAGQDLVRGAVYTGDRR